MLSLWRQFAGPSAGDFPGGRYPPCVNLSPMSPARTPLSAPCASASAAPPRLDDLQRVPWWPLLVAVESDRVAADIQVAEAEVGEFLCRIGRLATSWLDVVDGLLKMNNDSAMGAPITFTGVPSDA